MNRGIEKACASAFHGKLDVPALLCLGVRFKVWQVLETPHPHVLGLEHSSSLSEMQNTTVSDNDKKDISTNGGECAKGGPRRQPVTASKVDRRQSRK